MLSASCENVTWNCHSIEHHLSFVAQKTSLKLIFAQLYGKFVFNLILIYLNFNIARILIAKYLSFR